MEPGNYALLRSCLKMILFPADYAGKLAILVFNLRNLQVFENMNFK